MFVPVQGYDDVLLPLWCCRAVSDLEIDEHRTRLFTCRPDLTVSWHNQSPSHGLCTFKELQASFALARGTLGLLYGLVEQDEYRCESGELTGCVLWWGEAGQTLP